MTCPQCRAVCRHDQLIRLHLSVASNDSIVDTSSQRDQIDRLKQELRDALTDINAKTSMLAKDKEQLKKCKQTILSLEAKANNLELLQSSLNAEIKVLRLSNKTIDGYKEKINKLEAKLADCENVQNVLTSTVAEVDELLKNKHTSKQLAIMVASLKREIQANERKKLELRNILKTGQRDQQLLQRQNLELKSKISGLESDLFNRSAAASTANILLAQQLESVGLKSSRSSTGGTVVSQQRELRIPDPNRLSASPYLPIKSSAVGLSPLGLSKKKMCSSDKCAAKRTIGESSSSSTGYTILKKPRLGMPKSVSDLGGDRVPNGLGGSEKNVRFSFSQSTKSVGLSTSDRLKKGALKNINNHIKPFK